MIVNQESEGHRSQYFKDPNERSLTIQLASLDKVEIITRSYRMSLNSFVNAIGGGLGFFLGFSIFTALSTIYEFLFLKFKACKHKATHVNIT